MQFPQINQYKSFIHERNQASFDYYSIFQFSGDQVVKESIEEVFDNIDEINLARSLNVSRLIDNDDSVQSNGTKSNNSCEYQSKFWNTESQSFNSEPKLKSYDKNKSLIFSQPDFIKNKQSSQLNELITLKLYYFNLPCFKVLSLNKNLKISDLISKAILQYMKDPTLDHSKIDNIAYELYQIRTLISPNSFQPNLNQQALNYQQILWKQKQQSLALVHKQFIQKKNHLNPILISKQAQKHIITLKLYNEVNEQIGLVSIDKNECLEKIYNYIEEKALNNLMNYQLTLSKEDDNSLPKDLQIKNLESNIIYIKRKRYIDESEYEQKNKKPVKFNLLESKQKQSPLKLPISITEASFYQQFEVIKINNMGFEQERILGIDQTKIYNYQKSMRQEKRQASFFSKIFGANQSTGTKIPFRLISDIKSLVKTDRGLIIAFNEKNIHYIIRNRENKQKIFRKLTCLVQFADQQRKAGRQILKNQKY